MRVSFIIPAYNAASYITRCLNSIFALGLATDEFEVIVIDDCSTDNTVQVIENFIYLQPHSITLLRQFANHRQGAARNRGISIAKGRYIVFVDSDDEVQPGIWQALCQAEENHLEIVAFHSQKVTIAGERKDNEILPYQRDDVFTGIELQSRHPYWGTAPWGYVYSSAFLRATNYPFAEDVLFEDADFVNVHLYAAKRMGYCSQPGYLFRENAFSTTHTTSFKHVADYFLLGTRMLRLYDGIEDKSTTYADSIREGGSFNIYMSFKRLFKLNTWRDVYDCFNRIDKQSDRNHYLNAREPAYCWNRWTHFCLSHRHLATMIVCLCILPKHILSFFREFK